ncbi:alpha/beta hydrolase [Actinocorallia longicatena]|uniref:S-formylglutathione hydrolase FrmB n=1 Tax=Actinocorallia longicatena TaxID=111803 RepID=A0ABP6QDB1_9ACTN
MRTRSSASPRVSRPFKRLLGVLAAAALLMPVAPAHAAQRPALTDQFGLTQVSSAASTASTNTDTNFVITVTTPQVAGEQNIRIMLPSDYAAHPTKRYPVLYFLHGSPDDPSSAFYGNAALADAEGIIKVVPDGGNRGWYANWVNQNTAAGAANWENFHINQVIPFIDANLRTIATKQARAIAGISMGGFGAFHYAQRHPDLFSQVGSLSGDLELGANQMSLRLVVVASLTNVTGAICASSSGTVACDGNAYAPGVDSDALFGSPYPVLNADWRWNKADPVANAAKLSGMGIHIYIGNGDGGVHDVREWLIESASVHMKAKLDSLGIPVHYENYGNGADWGTYCVGGGHEIGCWYEDLLDLMPRLQASLTPAA